MTKEKETSKKQIFGDVYVRPPQHGKETYSIDFRPLGLTLDLSEYDLYRLCSFANNEYEFRRQFQIVLADAIDQIQNDNHKTYEDREATTSRVVNWRRHRTIKDRLMVESLLLIKDGCRIEVQYTPQINPDKQKPGVKSTGHAPIKLELDLSEDALQRLYAYANNAVDFSWQFFKMLTKAIDQIQGGKRDGKTTSIFWMKYYARLLFELFSALAEMPHDKQPSYFKILLAKIEDESKEFALRFNQEMGNLDEEKIAEYSSKFKSRFYRQNNNPYPLALAMYCVDRYQALMLERVHGKIRRKSLIGLRLKSQLKEHLSSNNKKALEIFRTTYVKDTVIPPECKRSSIMKKSAVELEDLVILKSPEELEDLTIKKLAEELGDHLTIEEKLDYTEHYHHIFSALELL